MKANTFLMSQVMREVHERGRKLDWWPFKDSQEFEHEIDSQNIKLRGNGDFLLVGLGRNDRLVIREVDGVEQAESITTDAFVLSYREINERIQSDIAV